MNNSLYRDTMKLTYRYYVLTQRNNSEGALGMEKQAQYWLHEAIESLDTAKVLYNNNKLLESAFFCHLSMEKILKAIFVQRNGTVPPKVHNLLVLTERSDLAKELNESQFNFLADLNPFQLEGRYPGDRALLYQSTPTTVFHDFIERTEVELKWFEQKLKSEE